MKLSYVKIVIGKSGVHNGKERGQQKTSQLEFKKNLLLVILLRNHLLH